MLASSVVWRRRRGARGGES